MNLLLFGINHNTAELAVREQLAIDPERTGDALSSLLSGLNADEAVILSTCNRTEICVASEPLITDDQALSWLANHAAVSREQVDAAAYIHRGSAAMRHLVTVAAGLDSMVLGEPQILGQMKSAVAMAVASSALNGGLRQAYDHVFTAVKRIRTDTAIGENPVSVAFAAVGLTRHIFSDLAECRGLLIGAGETIELVARHLRERGIGHLTIANRTEERAADLATALGGSAIALSGIPEALENVDIIVSSTASQLPILGKGAVEQALHKRRNRPYLMIDLAVPRDIESQVSNLDDVYLYTVDDLRGIVEENSRQRQQEAAKAATLVDASVLQWEEKCRQQSAVGVIKAWRGETTRLQEEELNKALRQLEAGQEPEETLRWLARSLTRKLTHEPTVRLREAGARGDTKVLGIAARLFGVDNGEDAL